jgi:hypothetical protein
MVALALVFAGAGVLAGAHGVESIMQGDRSEFLVSVLACAVCLYLAVRFLVEGRNDGR